MLLHLVMALALSTETEQKMREAQALFYAERYLEAAAAAEEARRLDPGDPSTYELRSTALLFELRECLCEMWAAEFERDIEAGLALTAHPRDNAARFFRAKLLLNRVWFRGGIRGERSVALGGNIREAKRLLQEVLRADPGHVRARTARGMVEYQIGRQPLWKRILVGGGDRQKGLRELRANAECADCDRFDALEAKFAWLDTLKREERREEAESLARTILRDLPESRSLHKFLSSAAK